MNDECPSEVQYANARLIAAAPELLEACKMLFAHAEDVFNAAKGETRLDGSPMVCEGNMIALEKALSAISKAEGH